MLLFGKLESGGQRASVPYYQRIGCLPRMTARAYRKVVGPARDFGKREFSARGRRGRKFKTPDRRT